MAASAATKSAQISTRVLTTNKHLIRWVEKMAELYREVAGNLRTLYTVAYQPTGERERGKWHEIRIEVPNTPLIARTKSGYFAR